MYTYVLKKPITKGSVNALMKLAGFHTSNKVKNHCTSGTFNLVNRNKPGLKRMLFNGTQQYNIPIFDRYIFVK